jgi:hypothetical protein
VQDEDNDIGRVSDLPAPPFPSETHLSGQFSNFKNSFQTPNNTAVTHRDTRFILRRRRRRPASSLHSPTHSPTHSSSRTYSGPCAQTLPIFLSLPRFSYSLNSRCEYDGDLLWVFRWNLPNGGPRRLPAGRHRRGHRANMLQPKCPDFFHSHFPAL